MKNTVLLFITILGFNFLSFGQYESYNLPSFISPSPNATSLINDGGIHIGKFTGTVNLNIPILNFAGRKLNLPINLGYKSNGIHVDELASTVGFGWNLNAGGVITRIIYDAPDEVGNIVMPTTGVYSPEMLSYLGAATAPNSNNTQPDIFSFNFNGYSGVFFLDENMNPVLLNPSPIKIEIYSSLDNELSNTTPVFKIIDPQGIIYWFGGDNASELSIDRTITSGCNSTHTPPSLPAQTAWYLTKITHYTGEEMIFTYDRYGYRYKSGLNQIYSESNYNPIDCTYETIVNAQMSLLKEISVTGFGKTVFSYSIGVPNSHGNKNKKLDKITLFNEDNLQQKEFEFTYDIFATDLTYKNFDVSIDETDEKRLFLKEVVESGRNGQFKKPYIFEYNSPNELPPRLTYAQDFWGYFNGESTNTHLVSTSGYPQFSQSLSSNRNANEIFGVKGILKKVTFPTGGYNEYFYESHRNYNNEKIGGVRIQKIISNEGNGLDNIKTFYYNTLDDFNNSSGIAISPQSAYSYYGDDSGQIYSLSSSTNFSLHLSHGYHIGYSSVIESLGLDFENGGIATKYNVQLPILPISMLNEYIPGTPNTNVYGNGNVIEEKILKKESNQFIVLKEVINTYGHNAILDKEIKVYNVRRRKENPIDHIHNYCITKYYVKSEWHYLESSIQNHYDVNGLNPVTLSTQYYYDNENHFQLTRTKTIDSEGIESLTKVIYPDDILVKSSLSGIPQISDNQLSSINKLKKDEQHRITIPIQIEKYKNDTLKTRQRINIKNWKNTYIGSESIIEQESYLVSKDSEPLDDKIIYYDYSNYGNPLEISKKNGTHIVYIWGYNHSKLIAKIENATYLEVETYLATTPYNTTINNIQISSDLDVDWNTEQILRTDLDEIRNALQDSQVTTYTYDPLIGMTSITDPSGYTSFYEYDDLNRLVFIKDNEGHILSENKYNYKN